MRSNRAAIAANQLEPNLGNEIAEEDLKISLRDGMKIAVRIHQPKMIPRDGCPALVMFHGGGFCLGNLDSETQFCRSWVRLGGVAVNVDYRLAPEAPFPIPVYDAFDALKWVSRESWSL